jgi:hypothetical protein
METINFGSFPRSGNHFFVNLADKLFVNTEVVWNEHKSFGPSNQNNIVTTIRNPADAVFSLCANTGEIDKKFIDSSLRWYRLYYEKIAEIGGLVIHFEELITSPFLCFINIVNTYNLNEPNLVETSIKNIEGKETSKQSDTLRQDVLGSAMLPAANQIFEEITQDKRGI